MRPFVYIMASKPYGTLYVGVTSNLPQRAWHHHDGVIEGFTKKYGVHRLVFYEEFATMPEAIQREHNIKHWSRRWKIKLIETMNPMWDDLYEHVRD
jgi:putative endonuclease